MGSIPVWNTTHQNTATGTGVLSRAGMDARNDAFFMERCLQLAALGAGSVGPNPMVGAVLVHDGRIIGEGFHAVYGAEHAEVACLNAVRAEDRHLIEGSTIYVSLEPCAHWGKQPPCADRLVAERIGRVVVCNDDPFEEVRGRGFQKLEAAGIAITRGVLEEQGRCLNRRFFTFHEKKRPYVILKWAQSADGFLGRPGERVQLTGPVAQRLVHRWRTEEAAIAVGKHTVLTDNPQLTARLWGGKQPLRIILSRDGAFSPDLAIFNSDAPTWVANCHREESFGNISYIKLPHDAFLPALADRLYISQIQSVIIEGGAEILNAVFAAGLWDEVRRFTAPITLGTGIPAPQIVNARLAETVLCGADRLENFARTDNA